MLLTHIFVIVLLSILIIIGLIYKCYIYPHEKYNYSKLAGKKGKVIIDLNFKEGTGQIILKNKIWSAISYSHEIIKTGSTVEVISSEGIKLIVREI